MAGGRKTPFPKPGGRKPNLAGPLPTPGFLGTSVVTGAAGAADTANADISDEATSDIWGNALDAPALGKRHTPPACGIAPGLAAGACSRGRPLIVCGVAG